MMQSVKIVGILNSTPDSFYSTSRIRTVLQAKECAQQMIEAGADIIDIGGESTRPESTEVSASEELSRIIPIIQAIRSVSDIPLSVDTRKAVVAQQAVKEGVGMINDVSGLCFDEKMPYVLAKYGVMVVVMHMRGIPQDMQQKANYNNVIAEVSKEIMERVEKAQEAGIQKEKIIIDPGIGFAKSVADNLRILASMSHFTRLGFPVYLGVSRKSFIGITLGSLDYPLPPEQRLEGTLAVQAWALLNGVSYLRVHDVRETAHLVTMLSTIKRYQHYARNINS